MCICWSPLGSRPGMASVVGLCVPELAAPSCWVGVFGGGSSPGGICVVVWGHIELDPCPRMRSGVVIGWIGVLKPGPYGVVPHQSVSVPLPRPRPPLPCRGGPSPGYPRVASNIRLVTCCSPLISSLPMWCAVPRCGVVALCMLVVGTRIHRVRLGV